MRLTHARDSKPFKRGNNHEATIAMTWVYTMDYYSALRMMAEIMRNPAICDNTDGP